MSQHDTHTNKSMKPPTHNKRSGVWVWHMGQRPWVYARTHNNKRGVSPNSQQEQLVLKYFKDTLLSFIRH